MDTAILLEYGWVLLVLIGLEGLLAADNAVVMAVMVKHLPKSRFLYQKTYLPTRMNSIATRIGYSVSCKQKTENYGSQQ